MRECFRRRGNPSPLVHEAMHSPALAIVSDQMKTTERLQRIATDVTGLEKREGRVLGGEAGRDEQGLASRLVEICPVDIESAVHRRFVTDQVPYLLLDRRAVLEFFQI